MANFLIVSNRLPVNVSRVDGTLQFTYSNGGLATAMSSLDIPGKLWIGWPGIASDSLTAAEKSLITKKLRSYGCIPVFLTAADVADFYEGYANDTLWPLFHYFPTISQHKSHYWEAYTRVNKKYLRAITAHSDEAATIWIHDYHLMLLPAAVRTALPATKIGFFLHVPFPSYEIFRALPEKKAIIEGLVGADLVGFHIYDYARHFISSCNRILGTSSEQGVIEYQGRRVKIDVFPIGIDYQKFRDALSHSNTREELAKLDEHYSGQRLILSVDRLDYSKGIMKRLEAYEKFLVDYPKFRRKVTMLMVAVPSRTEVEAYKQLRDEIEQTVSRINGVYGTVDWAPISYRFQNLEFHQIVALYAKAEIALVTPLRDGMNLVAKEYVASKKNRKGVLILSEMTGAVDELSDALIVNPNNISEIVSTLHHALTMPNTEQQRRLNAMQVRISDYTVTKWSNDFIEQLVSAKSSHTDALKKRLTEQDFGTIIKSFITSKRRLLLVDYDGTLHHFSTSIGAHAVKPGPKLKSQLRQISEQRATNMCVISGRPRAILDAWFHDVPKLLLVAEHGAWIKRDGVWHQQAEIFDKSAIVSLLKSYAVRTPGALVEEKDFAVVWHYRRVNPELAFIRNSALRYELHELLRGSNLVVHSGNKIIEIKPEAISKGAIASQLLERYPADFVFAAGDDYTDESTFEALPESAITVKVGFGMTKARYQVGKLEKILELLAAMSKIIR